MFAFQQIRRYYFYPLAIIPHQTKLKQEESMNKSVAECVTRFRGKPESVLPTLVHEIVGKIENELNESRVKRFIYDGENTSIFASNFSPTH